MRGWSIYYFVMAAICASLVLVGTGCFLHARYDKEVTSCTFTDGKYEVYLELNHDTDQSYDRDTEQKVATICKLLGEAVKK